jgi:hypothetical protein
MLLQEATLMKFTIPQSPHYRMGARGLMKKKILHPLECESLNETEATRYEHDAFLPFLLLDNLIVAVQQASQF